MSSKDYCVANIPLVKYEKLLTRDPVEMTRLFDACEQWGFFYLSLDTEQMTDYTFNVTALFGAAKEYFAQPLEEKLKDMSKDIQVYNICGYKPMGSLGLDEGNMRQKSNGSENLRVPIDLFYNPRAQPRLSFPRGMQKHEVQFASFIKQSREVAMKILESLSDHLGLESDQRFESFHRVDEISTSSAVLQHYPRTNLPEGTSAGHFAHTDTGSITVLFNTEWGLQVFSPRTDNWEYVPPRDGCAIVNVGDSLKFISHSKLKSSLHRVIPSSPHWVCESRYAAIFFLRASNSVQFTDTEGIRWTGASWLEAKFQNYRRAHSEQEKNTISTGKLDFSGLWDGAENGALLRGS
ncbi:2OG-Fe(II) oxygenase family oxidoreductase [Pochonia chlamydosporia 170]|uniref:2OG-Fe(II) oxygenase family oxidoreductase n=1 Tax=Pochonia chlamydosporia 170 TaxID=1380566 RepID=A0A179FJ93_METCM|nr:2OG-Fe(II) oxygenase family oxidoreductase [Pochonia chlamydosporia 170]OAQ65331.1 2OG-Fe(II) oxygenase family oxidoreductase [Pochonia chlamydosporia 170]